MSNGLLTSITVDAGTALATRSHPSTTRQPGPTRRQHNGSLHDPRGSSGRAKALVYQTAILDPHTHDARGWRSLFIDQLHHATLSNDPWTTADNYSPHTTGIDTLAAVLT